MKLDNGMTVGLLAFGFAVAIAASPAVAAPQNNLVPTKSEIELPKFGFTGENVDGVGDRIVTLTPDGRFAKLGIEVGDIVMSVNGFKTSYAGSWRDAMLHARGQKATTLHLQIKDSRTLKVRSRDISVSFATAGLSSAQKAKLSELKKLMRAWELEAQWWQQKGGIGSTQMVEALTKKIQNAHDQLVELEDGA